MAGLKMDAAVVGEYAETAEAAAEELDAAAAGEALPAESFGDLGQLIGLGASYGRAVDALSRQLADGAEALRSAAEALAQVTVRHGGQDAEAAELIKRAGSLDG